MLDKKWTGTDADRHDMKKLKLEQVVRVSALTVLVLLALPDYSHSVISAHLLCLVSPQHYYVLGKPCRVSYFPSNGFDANLNHFSTLGVALPNGGTAGLFWNYVIAAVGLGFVYASIAELGSM
jgi:hypothetical protein